MFETTNHSWLLLSTSNMMKVLNRPTEPEPARSLLKSSPSCGRAVGPRNESRRSGRIWQDVILGGKDFRCSWQHIPTHSYLTINIFQHTLAGGFKMFQTLKQIWKSVGIMTFPRYGNIKHVPNHQPAQLHDYHSEGWLKRLNRASTLHDFKHDVTVVVSRFPTLIGQDTKVLPWILK